MVRMTAQVWPNANPSFLLFRFLDWRETHLAMTQLKESSQLASLGTLTRSLSHEILNPVSVIGGYARRLLDSLQPDSKEKEWTEQMIDGVEKLESVIETIRTFLNLPSPSFENYPLNDLWKKSLGNIRQEAGEVGVRITDEDSRKLPSIFMDPILLEKAFSAILLNALDRMPRGGELTLGQSCDEGRCQITVEDSGPTLDTWQMEEDLSPIHVI